MFQMSQAKLCVCGVEMAGTKTKVYNSEKIKEKNRYCICIDEFGQE